MALEGRARGRSTKTLPLNSGRLTATLIRRIARGLGLDISASLEDARQVVSGEMGREPQNVRVDLTDTDRGMVIHLRDERGVIMESQPEESTVEDERDDAEDGRSMRDGSVTSPRGTPDREAELQAELARVMEENAGLTAEVSTLKDEEKKKYKQLWRESCGQLSEHDAVMADKEKEIAILRARVAELEGRDVPSPRVAHTSDSMSYSTHPGPELPPSTTARPDRVVSRITPSPVAPVCSRHGKAPPVDPFDGENPNVTFEDWYPTLMRAAHWNHWTEDKSLMQLAGHLHKRALIEWNLLSEESLVTATEALRSRLDPGLAAQEFRHAVQKESEPGWSKSTGRLMDGMGCLLRHEPPYYTVNSRRDWPMTSCELLLCLGHRNLGSSV